MYKDFIAITNGSLYGDKYFENVEKIVALRPYALILREKELEDAEYLKVAKRVKRMCEEKGVIFFLHQRIHLADELNCKSVHLSYKNFLENREGLGTFERVSVACHSLEEAIECDKENVSQIVLGTIFETDCKKGLKGKGLEFVKEVSQSCRIPIYAIGGIKESNIESIKQAGATGGCMMSGFVKA